MKQIILVFAGMADEPLDALDDKTPMEVAKIPHMRRLAQEGFVGRLRLADDKGNASEEAVCFGALGYPVDGGKTARGPILASAIELTPGPGQVLLACRLVTVADDKLVDSQAGQIGARESAVLLEALNRAFKEKNIRFYLGPDRTHVLSILDTPELKISDSLTDLNLKDPDGMVGRDLWAGWGRSAAANSLKEILTEAFELLDSHEINKVRVDLSENPANALWVWGAGQPLTLAPFAVPAAKTAVLAVSDIWKGVARAAAITASPIFSDPQAEPSALAGLTDRLMDWVRQKELVIVHLDAADRASMTGDYKKKIRWIEAFDQHIVGPLSQNVGTAARIAIISGYVASSARRERVSAEAPMLLWGSGIQPSKSSNWSEEAASGSSAQITGGQAFLKKVME